MLAKNKITSTPEAKSEKHQKPQMMSSISEVNSQDEMGSKFTFRGKKLNDRDS